MRLFISIDLPQQAKRAVEPLRLALEKTRGLSLSPADQLHCTLCFIGEVSSQESPALVQRLAAVQFRGPISVELRELGAFPSLLRSRVVWVGLHSPELARLSEQLHSALSLKLEKPVKLHCTVARVKNSANLSFLKHFPLQPICFNVTSFELKQSTLSKWGALHTTISSFKIN